MKRTTKILAILLSVCMLAAFLPAASLADSDETVRLYTVFDVGTKTLFVGMGERPDKDDEAGVTFKINNYTNTTLFGIYNTPDYDDAPGLVHMSTFGIPGPLAEQVEKIVFLNVIRPETATFWFAGMEKLKSMDDFTGWEMVDTGDVSAMMGTFMNCSSLESVDLSFLDTGSVQTMAYMFLYDVALKEAKLAGLDAKNVKELGAMFLYCVSLERLDLSGFSTENVEDMSLTFAFCPSLQELDLSSFDTEKTACTEYMFVNCIGLKNLTLGEHFNTANVTNMQGMFAGCKSLTALDLGSFTVTDDTHMGGMFAFCDSLSSLTLGEDFKFTFLEPIVDDDGDDGDDADDEDFGYDFCDPAEIDFTSPDLPEPPQNDDYTGLWVLEGSDQYRFTSAELMKNYDGKTMAGTWIWEQKEKSLANAEIVCEPQTFIGEALQPTVTVTLNGRQLTEGEDFEISGYENNINAGTATVTVTGKGRYKDSASGTFAILPAGLSGANVSADAQTYAGGPATPPVTVTAGGKTLTEGKDFTVSYQNNDAAGEAAFTVTGLGNYKGTAAGTFTISPADLAGATVTVPDQIYTGQALTPAVTVTLNGVTLTAGTDYTVEYSDNTELTQAAAVLVTGTGNYTGTVSGAFRIKTEDGVDFLLGDVDGNGKVEAADARFALRAAVGLDDTAVGLDFSKKTNRCFLAADVTKDKTIQAADARLILRAAVGLETLS